MPARSIGLLVSSCPLGVKTSNMQDEQMLSGRHWIPDMQNAPQRAWGVLTIRSRSLLAIFIGERPVRRDEQSQSRFSREIQGRICREWRAPFRKTSMQATTYDQVNRTCRACTQWRLAHAFGHSCRPPLNFDFYSETPTREEGIGNPQAQFDHSSRLAWQPLFHLKWDRSGGFWPFLVGISLPSAPRK